MRDLRSSLLILAPVLLAVCASCSSEPRSASASMEKNPPAEPTPSTDHATGAHGDHTPHHGGTVYMNGDLHFEVVLQRDGNHRLYFSDAARAELPAATASEVTLTFSSGESPGNTLRAEIDGNGESWIMKGPPPAGTGATVRVTFVVEDAPYWIDVPYIEGAGIDTPKVTMAEP